MNIFNKKNHALELPAIAKKVNNWVQTEIKIQMLLFKRLSQ
jgi:hypothetical protein